MYTKKIFFTGCLFCLFFLSSCKQAGGNQTKKTEESTFIAVLPEEMKQKMLMEVDYIDYIWHDLPFSVSQEEKEGINTNIKFIGPESVSQIPAHCKSIGRKTYNIKGNTYMTADVYFSPGCAFYVFLDGEKPIYANKMTAQGINFYTQIINANSATKQEK
ncbi:MAG: hypothetical protein IPN29_08500 [Saprospiraceae bacterium]|nr:hypothetical protein [Saprospiraceae bacterium]